VSTLTTATTTSRQASTHSLTFCRAQSLSSSGGLAISTSSCWSYSWYVLALYSILQFLQQGFLFCRECKCKDTTAVCTASYSIKCVNSVTLAKTLQHCSLALAYTLLSICTLQLHYIVSRFTFDFPPNTLFVHTLLINYNCVIIYI
jgi:hypothetical protein